MAVKDIVDTADFPTENGSVLHAGRRPLHDAAIVARLRAAGAVVLGKTVTTEFACFTPGKTRNPHDLGRTPGGSSSGSAAAVAAGMAPLAIGSQTNGSVIRPASFCGVVGFKPSYGLIPRTGVLDHLGDARPCRRVRPLGRGRGAAWPRRWPASTPATPRRGRCRRRRCGGWPLTPPPVPPRLAFVRGPTWGEAEPATREAFAELAESAGRPAGRRGAARAVRRPRSRSTARSGPRSWPSTWPPEYERGRERLSERLRELIEAGPRDAGARVPARPGDPPRATRRRSTRLFHEFDAIVTPAAPGEAPVGLAATGSPAFCTLWSLAGAPAVSLPILQGPAGLPLGVQLVGALGDDARLLRTARWLVAHDRRRNRGGRAEMSANLIPAAIGFLLFALFVGYLTLKIAALPLTVIVGAVMLMCLYDFVRSIARGVDAGRGRRALRAQTARCDGR